MSFERLEQLRERESRFLPKTILNPTVVRSLDDIKRVLSELDPERAGRSNEVSINATISDDNKSYAVSTSSKSKSRREHLIEGIDVVRKQLEANDRAINDEDSYVQINGHVMKPPHLSGGRGQYWIDPIIKHWLGGYRDGIYICWDIDGYQYRYDIYQHKLSRVALNEK